MDFLIFGPQNWVRGPFFLVWMVQDGVGTLKKSKIAVLDRSEKDPQKLAGVRPPQAYILALKFAENVQNHAFENVYMIYIFIYVFLYMLM